MFLNNEYYLLNKDNRILKFAIEKSGINKRGAVIKESFTELRPFGFTDVDSWLENRKAPKHRKHIEELLLKCQCLDTEGYIRFTHALSLNDTFWVKPTDSELSWDDVSLYKNEFDETISRIAFEGGLFGEVVSTTTPELATDGSFAKCWIREDNGIYLMKTGSAGAANAGMEPYSEALASQVARIICKNYVEYDVVNFRNQLCSKCRLFSNEEEGFVQVAKIFSRKASEDDIFKYFVENGMEDDFRRMLVLDALIINVDRHMGNYGIVVNNDTQEVLKMAPAFDHNMALLPYAVKDTFENLDEYLSTRPVKFGEDFNEIAHYMLTPEIKSDLQNLRGFHFNFEATEEFPEWRIKKLENLIQKQIDNILHQKRLYMPVQYDVEQKLANPGKKQVIIATKGIYPKI